MNLIKQWLSFFGKLEFSLASFQFVASEFSILASEFSISR